MPARSISCMKFLFVLAPAAVITYVIKREAKCTLLIVQHLLLFCSLLQWQIFGLILFIYYVSVLA